MGANDYRVNMGFKTKTYNVNMLKKNIAREREADVVPTIHKDGATVAVDGVFQHDTDQELGEVLRWRCSERRVLRDNVN